MDHDARLDWLLARRSAGTLTEPGPTDSQIARLLAAAGTVPDHGELRPFRFAVIRGEGRATFGNALADAARERNPALSDTAAEAMRAKAQRSPTIIVVIASPKPGKIEVWEQTATAACAGYAIVLAAYALDIGAVWKSVPFTRGKGLSELLHLTPTEDMLGWIHLGTSTKPPKPRAAFDPASATMIIEH